MRKMIFLMAACIAVAAGAQTASTPLQLPSSLPAPVREMMRMALPASGITSSNPVVTAAAAAAASARTAPPGLLNGYVPDDTYKLRVGDTVSFQIVEDQIWDPQNAPKILVVQDSGEIEVPYVGRVMSIKIFSPLRRCSSSSSRFRW